MVNFILGKPMCSESLLLLPPCQLKPLEHSCLISLVNKVFPLTELNFTPLSLGVNCKDCCA